MQSSEVWIKTYSSPKLVEPVAIVGSPGLRSIGKLVVDSLIAKTKAQPIADLYSMHQASIYQTAPSNAADPALPGMGGALVEAGSMDLPKVQIFASVDPPLIFTLGYHANFAGQYLLAHKVIEFLSKMQSNA
jgi:hypothetical protein